MEKRIVALRTYFGLYDIVSKIFSELSYKIDNTIDEKATLKEVIQHANSVPTFQLALVAFRDGHDRNHQPINGIMVIAKLLRQYPKWTRFVKFILPIKKKTGTLRFKSCWEDNQDVLGCGQILPVTENYIRTYPEEFKKNLRQFIAGGLKREFLVLGAEESKLLQKIGCEEPSTPITVRLSP